MQSHTDSDLQARTGEISDTMAELGELMAELSDSMGKVADELAEFDEGTRDPQSKVVSRSDGSVATRGFAAADD